MSGALRNAVARGMLSVPWVVGLLTVITLLLLAMAVLAEAWMGAEARTASLLYTCGNTAFGVLIGALGMAARNTFKGSDTATGEGEA